MPATITPLQKPKQASRNLTQEIEQARRELEEQLDSYVMLVKHYGPEPPRETQLFVYLLRASLTPKQHAILADANEYFSTLGIECEVYRKPLRLRTHDPENPYDYCSPPEEEAQEDIEVFTLDESFPF